MKGVIIERIPPTARPLTKMEGRKYDNLKEVSGNFLTK